MITQREPWRKTENKTLTQIIFNAWGFELIPLQGFNYLLSSKSKKSQSLKQLQAIKFWIASQRKNGSFCIHLFFLRKIFFCSILIEDKKSDFQSHYHNKSDFESIGLQHVTLRIKSSTTCRFSNQKFYNVSDFVSNFLVTFKVIFQPSTTRFFQAIFSHTTMSNYS